MIIDIYTHIFPEVFFRKLIETSSGLGSLAARMQAVKSVMDLDQRFREMDVLDDYRQVIALPHPALEEVAEPEQAALLAGLANDGLAELCARHPDRFAAFIATVSLSDVDKAVQEIDRAVTRLGLQLIPHLPVAELIETARAAAELWRARELDAEANHVEIPESWGESQDVTASVDMRAAVRNIQKILNKNGYQAGGEDGLMGQKTKTAIAAFQKDNGMAPTGQVDEALVRALLERR